MVNFSQHFTVDMSGEFRIISLESLCLSSFLVSSSNRLLSMCLGTGHCISSVQSFSRVLTLCNPSDCSMPGFPVHHQLLQLAQTHVHRVSDAIQPSHPLSSPSPKIDTKTFYLPNYNSELLEALGWNKGKKVKASVKDIFPKTTGKEQE